MMTMTPNHRWTGAGVAAGAALRRGSADGKSGTVLGTGSTGSSGSVTSGSGGSSSSDAYGEVRAKSSCTDGTSSQSSSFMFRSG